MISPNGSAPLSAGEQGTNLFPLRRSVSLGVASPLNYALKIPPPTWRIGKKVEAGIWRPAYPSCSVAHSYIRSPGDLQGARGGLAAAIMLVLMMRDS